MSGLLEGHKVRDPNTMGARLEVQLDQAAAEVARRCGDQFPKERVRAAVGEAYRRLAAQASVTPFLPILAARSAQRSLGG